MIRAVSLLLACALVVPGLAACSGGKDAVNQGDTFEFVSPGGQTNIRYDPPSSRKKIAPLHGPSLTDPSKQIDVDKDFPGKVVVINLWGQWCGPCRAEAADLQRVFTEIGPKGGQVLGIDLRDPNRQAAVDFVTDRGVTYPSIWDPSQAAVAALRGFPTSVVPSTIVLDRKHRVAAVYLAAVHDFQVEALVDDLLAEGDS